MKTNQLVTQKLMSKEKFCSKGYMNIHKTAKDAAQSFMGGKVSNATVAFSGIWPM